MVSMIKKTYSIINIFKKKKPSNNGFLLLIQLLRYTYVCIYLYLCIKIVKYEYLLKAHIKRAHLSHKSPDAPQKQKLTKNKKFN